MSGIERVAGLVRDGRGVSHKSDIAQVVRRLGLSGADAVPVGDDTAMLPDPAGGHLLFAIEGLRDDFVATDPWLAGYCGVMANMSDVAAMGGYPIALVDALWSTGEECAFAVLDGMAEASRKYGVPIVGGHSNLRASTAQLSVAVLGRARKPITSFDAQPGDTVIVAIDLRGHFREPYLLWDASTDAPAERLRGDLAILAALARDDLATAGKDIGTAGIIGTAIALAEASAVGMRIDVEALPHPEGVDLDRWLAAFPSFGFLLTARARDVAQLLLRFHDRDIAAAAVGQVTADHRLMVEKGADGALVWNLSTPFTGCSRVAS